MQTVSAQISWSHNVAVMEKVKNEQERIRYLEQAAENGWSYNVLIHQIEANLYSRRAIPEKVTNFSAKLPSPQSELATQMMKDP